MLLLDEPTNDLDVDTLRALEEALLELRRLRRRIISHDRWFLDRIATHILAFEGDSHVEWFEGNFQDYEADLKRRLGTDADRAAPHQVQAAGPRFAARTEVSMNPPRKSRDADWAWGTSTALHLRYPCPAGAVTSRVEYGDRPCEARRYFHHLSRVMALAVTLVTALTHRRGRHLGDRLPVDRRHCRQLVGDALFVGALTTYGDTNIHVEYRWKMLGALEALNGMLLFGLTTAFLFAMIQRVWPASARYTRSSHLGDGLEGRGRRPAYAASSDIGTKPAPASPSAPTRDPGAP